MTSSSRRWFAGLSAVLGGIAIAAAPGVLAQQPTAPPAPGAPGAPAAAVQAGPTTAEDHQNMKDQLGIKALRPGPSGNESAPNHANYDEATANPFPVLPDVLTMKNGRKVTTAAQWAQRRLEILEDFDREVLGRVPKNVPKVTWTVTETLPSTVGGRPVIGKKLIGHVDNSSHPAINVDIQMTLVVPADAKGPVPVMMMFGGGTLLPGQTAPARGGFPGRGPAAPGAAGTPGGPGAGAPGAPPAAGAPAAGAPAAGAPAAGAPGTGGTPAAPVGAPAVAAAPGAAAAGRGALAGRAGGPAGAPATPADPPATQQLIADGWGYAQINPGSIQADNGAGLTRGIIGLVNKGQFRKPDDWGSLRAWAWGASRGLDYLETEKLVDAKKVGIEGVSRYGKAALVTMAYDTRFALVLVGSSGEGGAKLHRRNWGEAVENLTGSGEYHWMAGNFLKYGTAESTFGSKNAGDIPVDAHQLIALCAPRLTFISYGVPERGDARWLDHQGSFMAAIAAQPVFRLLGAKDLGRSDDYMKEKMPAVNVSLMDGQLAWRQHDGGHTDGPNWKYFIPWADKFLKHAPDPGGAAK